MLRIHFSGGFGRRVADVLRDADPATCVIDDSMAVPDAGAEAGTEASSDLVFCGSALNLARFRSLASSLGEGRKMVGAFVFEQYVFVSPAVGGGARLCAACYAARVLSHPPAAITEFAVASAERFCAERPNFEYRGLGGGLAQMVAHIACRQLQSPSSNIALALEIGSTRLLADPVMALHGCSCRSSRGASSLGSRRFTAFARELNEMTGAAPC